MKVTKKPEHHSFPHGIVLFSTREGELFYQISFWTTQNRKILTEKMPVRDEQHLKQLQTMTAHEVVQ